MKYKKYIAYSLTAMMLLQCMPLNTFATDKIVTNDEGNKSEAVLNAEAARFSVTLPTVLPIDIDKNNNVTVATDIKLENNSAAPIKVSGISIDPINNWNKKEDSSVGERIGTKDFYMTCELDQYTIVKGGDSLINYSAIVSPQLNATSEAIANVVFIVDWFEDDVISIDIGGDSVLKIGDTKYISLSYFNEADEIINWTSSDPSVATVEISEARGRSTPIGKHTAKIIGVGAGEFTITAEVGSGKQASANLTVLPKQHADGLTILGNPTQTAYIEGETFNKQGLSIGYSNGYTIEEIFGFTILNEELKVGQTTVTVNYKGYTLEIPITVAAKELTEISIKNMPTQTKYIEGRTFIGNGLVLKATYNNGTTADITTGFTITRGTSLTVGQTTVTVNYSGRTLEIPITVVAKELTEIQVASNPTKITYIEGQDLDTTGLKVNLIFNNEDIIASQISELVLENAKSLTVGQTTVTVRHKDYQGQTTTIPITVVAKELTEISVKTPPTKVSYIEGQNFNQAGLVLKATYNNGTTADITTGFTLTNNNSLTVGQTTVTVAYNGQTTTIPITVVAKELTEISVKTPPTKVSYIEGQNFNQAGLVLKATYNNGTTADITTGFTLTNNINMTSNIVTVLYGGKSVNINITLEAKVQTSIKLVTPPTKVTYKEEENFDTAGIDIHVVYNNGKTESLSLSDITYTGGANLASETTSITASYKGFVVNIPITVVGKYLATDADFSGTTDGTFKYIGTSDFVEIPHVIKGVPVTRYNSMFNGTSVKGVKSTNTNVTNMNGMFSVSRATTLDLSSFNTSNVTDMSYMFSGSQATTLDLSSFDTSNVTTMRNMLYNSKATTLDISGFNTSKVTNMSNMLSSSQATTIDVSGFNTSNVTDMSNMFSVSRATTLDVSSFDTSNVTNMYGMFSGSQATILDVSSLDTSKVTTMSSMFSASKATILDLSSFDTSNVTNMYGMFYNSKATTLDISSFDTSKVTNMGDMFYNSQATTIDVSGFNTSKVTNMNDMFSGSQATTIDVSGFNTSNVTDMNDMFYNSKATTIDLSGFNTSNVTNMSNMFNSSRATTLDLSSFDTPNVTAMNGMFSGSQATTLDLSSFNTSNVTDMNSMFNASKATTIDISGFNISNITDMRKMFFNSTATTLDLSSFDTSNITNMRGMFQGSQATTIDVSSFNTSNVTDMVYMFKNSKATTIDLSSFDTSNVTNMIGMFEGTEHNILDISSFDISKADINGIFYNSSIDRGYARTADEAARLNNAYMSNIFTVK